MPPTNPEAKWTAEPWSQAFMGDTPVLVDSQGRTIASFHGAKAVENRDYVARMRNQQEAIRELVEAARVMLLADTTDQHEWRRRDDALRSALSKFPDNRKEG